MKKKSIGLLVAIVSLFAVACGADANPPLPTPSTLGEFEPVREGFYSITAGELKDIVYFLADPAQEGRRNGTEGNENAGRFLRLQLDTALFRVSGSKTFYQPFQFREVRHPFHDPPANTLIERFKDAGYAVTEQGKNIIGVLEGTTKKDEYVLVIAHYDHVGFQFGELHPGADDNASGTAAVIEIAEAFGTLASDGIRPARSIVFALFDAEEWGLWGSQYFVEQYPISLENIAAVINLDMVGRNDPQELQVIGSENIDDFGTRNPDIARATERANVILKFKIVLPAEEGRKEHIFFRSDHASFYLMSKETNRVPIVFYTTGLHDDYHKPSDTADKINYGKLQGIARLAFLVAWQIANSNNTPTYLEN